MLSRRLLVPLLPVALALTSACQTVRDASLVKADELPQLACDEGEPTHLTLAALPAMPSASVVHFQAGTEFELEAPTSGHTVRLDACLVDGTKLKLKRIILLEFGATTTFE